MRGPHSGRRHWEGARSARNCKKKRKERKDLPVFEGEERARGGQDTKKGEPVRDTYIQEGDSSDLSLMSEYGRGPERKGLLRIGNTDRATEDSLAQRVVRL